MEMFLTKRAEPEELLAPNRLILSKTGQGNLLQEQRLKELRERERQIDET